MGTYKNDYLKHEDEMLWELHEIRHQLHKEFANRDIDEINNELKEIYKSWKKEITEKSSA